MAEGKLTVGNVGCSVDANAGQPVLTGPLDVEGAQSVKKSFRAIKRGWNSGFVVR